MEYISSKKFIPKLKTSNYMIGSFDVFLEQTKALMDKNINARGFLGLKKNEYLLNRLPIAYRASIVKNDGISYVGYISVFEIVYEDSMASIILETVDRLDKIDLDEIIVSYKEFLYNDLGIKNIKHLYIINSDKATMKNNDFEIKYSELKSDYFQQRS